MQINQEHKQYDIKKTKRNREYRSFEKAREFVRSLNLGSYAEFLNWARSGNKPEDIPLKPERTYKKLGWNNWGDFLGTGSIAPKDRKYLPFNEARDYVRGLNLKKREEWIISVKSGNIPFNIPAYPDVSYENKGWCDWGDFLGTGFIARMSV